MSLSCFYNFCSGSTRRDTAASIWFLKWDSGSRTQETTKSRSIMGRRERFSEAQWEPGILLQLQSPPFVRDDGMRWKWGEFSRASQLATSCPTGKEQVAAGGIAGRVATGGISFARCPCHRNSHMTLESLCTRVLFLRKRVYSERSASTGSIMAARLAG